MERGTFTLDGKTLRVLALRSPRGSRSRRRSIRRPAASSARAATTGALKVEFVTTYSDFRTVDGVLVPFREGNWANGKTTGETVLERVTFVPAHPVVFKP